MTYMFRWKVLCSVVCWLLLMSLDGATSSTTEWPSSLPDTTMDSMTVAETVTETVTAAEASTQALTTTIIGNEPTTQNVTTGTTQSPPLTSATTGNPSSGVTVDGGGGGGGGSGVTDPVSTSVPTGSGSTPTATESSSQTGNTSQGGGALATTTTGQSANETSTTDSSAGPTGSTIHPITCYECNGTNCTTARDPTVHENETCASNIGICFVLFDLETSTATRGCSSAVESTSSCDAAYPDGVYAQGHCEFCCTADHCNNFAATTSECEELRDSGSIMTKPSAGHVMLGLFAYSLHSLVGRIL